MGTPFYDFLRPGSILSIRCSKEEHLDEVTQVQPEFDTFWDEEISVSLSRDDEDMIYEDPMEGYMIVPSLYEDNNEEWINPFSTIIEDETSPNF